MSVEKLTKLFTQYSTASNINTSDKQNATVNPFESVKVSDISVSDVKLSSESIMDLAKNAKTDNEKSIWNNISSIFSQNAEQLSALIKMYDKDNNNEISGVEMTSFLNDLAAQSGNSKTLDVSDFDIANFNIDDYVADDQALADSYNQSVGNNAAQTSSAGGGSAASGVSSAGGATSSSASSGAKSTTAAASDSSNLSIEDQAEKLQTETIPADEKAVADVHTKKAEDRKAADEEYKAAIEKDEKITQELKDSYTTVIEDLSKNDEAIGNNDNEITSTETSISEANNSIASTQSALGSLPSSDKPEEQAAIDAQRNDLNNQLTTQQNALKDLETKLGELNAKKTELEGTKTTLTTEKERLDLEIEKVASEETLKAKAKYEETIKNIETKAEEDLKTAKDTLAADRQKLTEIQAKIDEQKAAAANPSEKAKKLEEEWSAKYPHLKGNTAFFEGIVDIANEINCKPEDLLSVMAFESGITSTAVNSKSGATGLIQFMGGQVSTSQSEVEQLGAVKNYLKEAKSYTMSSDAPLDMSTLYALVFSPGYAQKENWYSQGQTAYAQNSGLDVNGDGVITKSEAASKIQAKYNEIYG